jgi:hypothetical protein
VWWKHLICGLHIVILKIVHGLLDVAIIFEWKLNPNKTDNITAPVSWPQYEIVW